MHANALSVEEVFGTAPLQHAADSRGILGSVLHPTEPRTDARTAAAAVAKETEASVCPPPAQAGRLWLVLDCALDGGQADRLVPLLLGQAVWCSDGTRVRVHSGQRLLWECTDLSQASPLVMSSVGVCAVPPTLIDAYAVIGGAQDTALAMCPLLKLV